MSLNPMPDANFTPQMAGYSGQGQFRFWCQKVLPIVYDDSLSYYELLNKVVVYLNHVIEDVAHEEENIQALLNAYNLLQGYVNTYFSSLDVQEEINIKLDEMAESGALLDVIMDTVIGTTNEYLGENLDDSVERLLPEVVEAQIDDVVAEQLPDVSSEQIPQVVTDWLDDNVDPVGSAVVVDSSLTVEGAAADAKKTGDEIRELDERTNGIAGMISNDSIFPFSLVDVNGKAAIIVDRNGFTSLLQKYILIEKEGISFTDGEMNKLNEISKTDVYDFAVCDRDGNVSFYVLDGNFHVNKLTASAVKCPELDDIFRDIEWKKYEKKKNENGNFNAEVNMFICYGQSWAQGYDSIAIQLEQRYDNIMLDSGIRNQPLESMIETATSFVPMVEQQGSATSGGANTLGETPVSAQSNMIKQLIEDENGFVPTDFIYKILGTSPGYGSTSLRQLSKGTSYYNRLVAQVVIAKNIADENNYSFNVPAFSWLQGGLGIVASGNTYADELEQLRADIDEDVKSITGQTNDVKCITWQAFPYGNSGSTAPFENAGEFYDRYVGASERYPNIICAGASYHLPHSLGLHFTNIGQDWIGAYLGIAYKRSIIDGVKFIPFKPISCRTNGNSIFIKFNVPIKPIKIDIIQVEACANYGFTVKRHSSGTITELDIDEVRVSGSDEIQIIMGDEFEPTDHIVYGEIGEPQNQYGPVNGNRGNIRDSQGDYLKYICGNGEPVRMDNWLVVFDKTISELEG